VSDLESMDEESAAAKLTAIASAELARARPGAAVEAAAEALQHSASARTRFLAARAFAQANESAKAEPLIRDLAGQPDAESRAYAKIVEGLIAIERGETRKAVAVIQDANKTFDTWLGLFDLGRALLAAGLPAQANAAFDACLNARRGEALALFVDEEPTYSYVAPVHYYAGRAKQALGVPAYAESYRDYLDLRRDSAEDPLLAEVRTLAAE
jgi:hypothetical protein